MTGTAMSAARWGSSLISLAAGWTIAPAEARAAADTASLIARTCAEAPLGRHEVSRRRLATFLLADEGVLIEPPDNPEAWIGRALATLDQNISAVTPTQRKVIEAIGRLQLQLGTESGPGPARAGLEAVPAQPGPRPEGWLFADGVSLFCRKEAPPPPGGGGGGLLDDGRLNLRLRATPEELGLTEEKRRAAGAATIGYQWERVEQDDGTTRRNSTVSVKGALGVVLAESGSDSAMLFAGYQLQRLRTEPPPQLAPGASERDRDTDLLEIGFNARRLFGRGGEGRFNLDLTGSGSVIFDRVANSERLRFSLLGIPDIRRRGMRPILPFCGFGYFLDLGFGFGGRCTVAIRAQANFFLDRGTRAPVANDEFALAGGEVRFEVAPMRNANLLQGGVIGGASYRYEASLLGDVSAIDRFAAYLKYRHWFDDDRFAIEGGFDFVDGTNPETFANEHRIVFGLGFIF